MNGLKTRYTKEVVKSLKEKFGFKNELAVPRIEKIVVSTGISSSISNPKKMEMIRNGLTMITGQKPIETKAKKAISSFKLKKGQEVGMKVTLRGERMFDFLDKLINITLPRTKDFKGVVNRFDGQGNLTIGFKEQLPFPEVEGSTDTFGLEVTIVTSAKKDEQAKELLKLLGMPFQEEK